MQGAVANAQLPLRALVACDGGIAPRSHACRRRHHRRPTRSPPPRAFGPAAEDTYKVVPDLGGQSDHLLLAVFDGHGQAGEKVAEFARDHIEETLVNLRRRQSSEPLQAYRTAFLQLNQRVRSDPTIDDNLSGTTAVSALFEGNQLHVANVGDSRAVMGERRDGRIVPTALSSDQTPYRPDERQRIRAAGGLVMSFTQLMGDAPLHDNWGVDLGQETDDSGDPPRIWQPDSQLPGCAFTRSIGDSIGEALGVTADPEIVSRTVSADDRILILASDGVWEFMTNQKAIDLVSGFDNPLDACRALLAEAYHLWMQYDTRTDDITAIVAFFEHPGEPPRASPSA